MRQVRAQEVHDLAAKDPPGVSLDPCFDRANEWVMLPTF